MTEGELELFLAKEGSIGERIMRQQANAKARIDAFALKVATAERLNLHPILDAARAALEQPGLPRTTRPTNRDGGTSFHFAISKVTKESGALMVPGLAPRGAAEAHQAYVERKNRAEKLLDADGLSSLAAIKVPPERDLASEALRGQAYVERAGAAEKFGEVIASFGNISESYDERLQFWRLVEAHERAPKNHKLYFYRAKDKEFWKKLSADQDAPKILVDLANDRVDQKRMDRGKFRADHEEKPSPWRDERACILLDTEETMAVKHYLETHNESKRALELKTRAGAVIQTRIIVELPHAFSPQDRLWVVKEFCRAFEERKDGDGELAPIRYHCVIHAPDAHGDVRNSHMHIVFYERPANKILDGLDRPLWDFTICVQSNYKSRNKRIVYPFAKPFDRTYHDIAWPRIARARFADIVNSKLTERGINIKYDPRSYADMELGIEPFSRLGRGEYALETSGKSTKSSALISERWRRVEDDITQRWGNTAYDNAIEQRFAAEAKRISKISVTLADATLAHRDRWSISSRLEKFFNGEEAITALIYEKLHSRLDPPLRKPGPLEPEVNILLDEVRRDIAENKRIAREHHELAASSLQFLCSVEKNELEACQSDNLDAPLPERAQKPNQLTDAVNRSPADFLKTAAQARAIDEHRAAAPPNQSTAAGPTPSTAKANARDSDAKSEQYPILKQVIHNILNYSATAKAEDSANQHSAPQPSAALQPEAPPTALTKGPSRISNPSSVTSAASQPTTSMAPSLPTRGSSPTAAPPTTPLPRQGVGRIGAGISVSRATPRAPRAPSLQIPVVFSAPSHPGPPSDRAAALPPARREQRVVEEVPKRAQSEPPLGGASSGRRVDRSASSAPAPAFQTRAALPAAAPSAPPAQTPSQPMPSSDRPAKSSSAPNKRQITIVDDLPVNDPMSHKPSADQHTGSALTGLAHAASIGPVLPDQGMKIPPDPPKRLVTIVGDTPKHTQSTTPLAATPRTNCAPPAGLTPTSAASAPAGSSDLDNSKTKGNTKKPTPEKIRRRARIAQAARNRDHGPDR